MTAPLAARTSATSSFRTVAQVDATPAADADGARGLVSAPSKFSGLTGSPFTLSTTCWSRVRDRDAQVSRSPASRPRRERKADSSRSRRRPGVVLEAAAGGLPPGGAPGQPVGRGLASVAAAASWREARASRKSTRRSAPARNSTKCEYARPAGASRRGNRAPRVASAARDVGPYDVCPRRDVVEVIAPLAIGPRRKRPSPR